LKNWNPAAIKPSLLGGTTNMKMFARKQEHQLSIVSPVAVKKTRSETAHNSVAIRNSFHGWLHKVTPITEGIRSVGPTFQKVPKLTAMDVMRVNHATIREGQSHCVWPPLVVRQFRSANVITTKKVPHYELKEVNLTRVG
jgi:hypothetical protein